MKKLLPWSSHKPPKQQPSPSPNTASAEPRSTIPAQSKNLFPSGLKTLYDNGASTIDVVFIHGLTGDRERTWRAKDAVDPWPQTLLPSKIPDARILTFGYDAYITKWGSVSNNRIGEHSMNLLTAVAAYREGNGTNDRPIIFVCHSLGGLVCQDAISLAHRRPERHLNQVAYSTRGIIFLGTPHHGSGLAHSAKSLAKTVSLVKQTNPEILGVLKTDSEILARVRGDFHNMIRSRLQDGLQPIEITCFFEELPLPNTSIVVVPCESATIPGYPSIGIRNNHRDMTKFEDLDDPGFIALVGELSRWCKDCCSSSVVRVFSATNKQNGQSENIPNQKSDVAAPTPITTPRKGCNTIPLGRDMNFIGREDLIKEIGHRIKANHRIAISGIGGIGKSQIAIEYSYRFQHEHPSAHVFWVYCGSRSRIQQGYKRIAEELTLLGRDRPDINIFNLVFRELSSGIYGRWLLIFDNVDDMETLENAATDPSTGVDSKESLMNYLPRSSEGFVLVTTRDNSVGRFLANNEIIKIDPMSLPEAQSLLLSKLRLRDTSDPEKVSQLVSSLDFLPLAITQAAAYILNYEITLDEYLDILSKDDQEISELLSEEEKDPRRDAESQSSITRTWKISFDKIRSNWPRSAEILCLMAIFDRQEVPENVLRGQEESEVRFKKALGKIKAFSLIAAGKNDSTVSMHRLVQLATRTWLKFYKEEERYKEEALKMLASAFPPGKYENWETCQILLPHAQVVTQYQFPGRLDVPYANLLHNLAVYDRSQGRYNLAFERFTYALSLKLKTAKLEDNADALRTFHYTAVTLSDRGMFEESKERHERVLRYSTDLFGQDHPDTLQSMNDYACCLSDLGRYAEAAELDQQILELRKKVLGPEHPDTLDSMHNYAVRLFRLKRHAEAAELDQQTLELRKKVLGPEHPNTLNSMNKYAADLSNLGRHAEAAELDQQILELHKKVLGPEHPNTLSSMHNYAVRLFRLKRHAEAAELDQQTLELCKKVLGPEHPDTLGSMHNYAVRLFRLKRHAEAAELDQQTLELRKKVLGPEHPDTLDSMNNYAADLSNLGRHAEAAELDQQTLELCKKVLGPEHSDTIRTANNLARVLSKLRRHEEVPLCQVEDTES